MILAAIPLWALAAFCGAVGTVALLKTFEDQCRDKELLISLGIFFCGFCLASMFSFVALKVMA